MKPFLIAFLLCVIGILNSPHSDSTITSFSTVDEAASIAMVISTFYSREFEYGGVVYTYDDTHFYYSPPKSDFEIASVSIRFKDVPEGARLAGIYHTHPCNFGYMTWTFSHQDVSLMVRSGVPIYLMDQCENKIHKLDYTKYIKYIEGVIIN